MSGHRFDNIGSSVRREEQPPGSYESESNPVWGQHSNDAIEIEDGDENELQGLELSIPSSSSKSGKKTHSVYYDALEEHLEDYKDVTVRVDVRKGQVYLPLFSLLPLVRQEKQHST